MSTNITKTSTMPAMPQECLEQVQNCIANGKLPLSPEAIYTIIKSKIAGPKDRNGDDGVTPMDVVEVLKTAVSAGIDPTSTDIFAFKSRDVLSVGISKKGWSKILDNRKGSVEYEYGPLLEGKNKLAPKVYEYVSAKITRADGTVVTGPRIYSDEFNTGKGAWLTNPKTMLTVRAFTQACALAYGIGAYDADEAEEIYIKNEPAPTNSNSQPLLTHESVHPSDPKFLEGIDSMEMLLSCFNKLPPEMQKNQAVKDNFAKRRHIIETKIEDLSHD